MSIKTLALGVAASALLAGGAIATSGSALAGEPLELTNVQLESVTAGNRFVARTEFRRADLRRVEGGTVQLVLDEYVSDTSVVNGNTGDIRSNVQVQNFSRLLADGAARGNGGRYEQTGYQQSARIVFP